MAKPHPGFTLSQLIKNTAEEISNARAESPKDAVMKFEGCELELAVTISADAGGAVKFWVIDASAKVKAETVSRVKLKFGPIPGQVIAAVVETGGDAGPAAHRPGSEEPGDGG